MHEHPFPKLACLLRNADDTKLLRAWVTGHLPGATLDELDQLDQLQPSSEHAAGAADPAAVRYQLVILDEPFAAQAERLPALWQGPRCPELVVVGLSSLAALRLRARGMPIAAELQQPLRAEDVALAIRHVLSVRLPLRRVSQAVLGQIALRDAVSLLRFYMLREALLLTRSKRAAARALGVTRPAVQSMAKTLAVPEPCAFTGGHTTALT